MKRRFADRRAAALLLALVALSIVTVGAVGALRAATTASLTVRAAAFDAQSEALARDVEPILVEWLERGSTKLGAGPDPSAFRPIFHESRDGVTVTIDALDLSGRLHVDYLASLAGQGLREPLQALRTVDPKRFMSRADARSDQRLRAPLDEVVAAAVEAGADPATLSVYPVRAEPQIDRSGTDQVVAAQWITTRGSGALNLNSAPMEVVRAALQGRDPGAAREAIAARERAATIPTGAIETLNAPTSSGGAAFARPGLVPVTGSSDVWAFLVAIESGGRSTRWWFAAESNASSRSRGVKAERFERPLPSSAREPDRPRAQRVWTIVERRRIEG